MATLPPSPILNASFISISIASCHHLLPRCYNHLVTWPLCIPFSTLKWTSIFWILSLITCSLCPQSNRAQESQRDPDPCPSGHISNHVLCGGGGRRHISLLLSFHGTRIPPSGAIPWLAGPGVFPSATTSLNFPEITCFHLSNSGIGWGGLFLRKASSNYPV